jgi:hypothetical protein
MKLHRDFTKSRCPLSVNYGRNFKQIDRVLVKLYTNGSAHGLVFGTCYAQCPMPQNLDSFDFADLFDFLLRVFLRILMYGEKVNNFVYFSLPHNSTPYTVKYDTVHSF